MLTRVAEKIDTIPIKACFIKDELLSLGRCTDDFNSAPLTVYNRARTICDFFKYPSKLDGELFNKAVSAYSRGKNKTTSNLEKYAKAMGIYDRVMNVMDVLKRG